MDKVKARDKRQGLGQKKNPHAYCEEAMKKHAAIQCRPVVEKYVACTTDKTFSAMFLCRADLKVMEQCMQQYENRFELATSVLFLRSNGDQRKRWQQDKLLKLIR